MFQRRKARSTFDLWNLTSKSGPLASTHLDTFSSSSVIFVCYFPPPLARLLLLDFSSRNLSCLRSADRKKQKHQEEGELPRPFQDLHLRHVHRPPPSLPPRGRPRLRGPHKGGHPVHRVALLQDPGDEGGHRAGRTHVGRSRVRRRRVDAILVCRSKAVSRICGHGLYLSIFLHCFIILFA